MPVKNFHWTYPKGVKPPQGLKQPHQHHAATEQEREGFLRLPVGVATALTQERLRQEQRQGVQFAADGSTPDWPLLKVLRTQIPDAAFLNDNPDEHRLAHIQKLLKWAQDAHVMTEVGPLRKKSAASCSEDYLGNDPQCLSARILQKQLTRFKSQPTKYDDVLPYPFSTDLLYWGSFQELRFEGQGLMFHRNGKIAYNGTWHKGSAHGKGQLLDDEGVLVWQGEFQYGLPVRTIYSAIHNFKWATAELEAQ
mmetsp:Transcript_26869/g.41998  ORF Transcript_26869/g.41998 Transcript_26869/m.41998 type:complete len:251 (-) Transcript_26869:68-820(-)